MDPITCSSHLYTVYLQLCSRARQILAVHKRAITHFVTFLEIEHLAKHSPAYVLFDCI